MIEKEIYASTLVKKITRKDTLFHGSFSIDPYQNCSFDCIYCDSTYDDTIYIKRNAVDVLKQEIVSLDKKRMIIGSVHDPYQKVEETYQLTRSILELLYDHQFPIHILTKSTRILRDLDILKKMDDVIVTFSILTVDESLSKSIERNVESPLQRLHVLKELKKNNIVSGIAIIPIFPYLTDDSLELLVKKTKDCNADYVLYKHLELKGDQKNIFFNFIKNNFPSILPLYEQMYDENISPSTQYIHDLDKKIKRICRKYDIPTSIPVR